MRIASAHTARRIVFPALALATVLACGVAGADEPDAGAMRVYRDPVTGAFVAPPASTTLPTATRALGTSAQGLVETPGTSAAGGVTMDLRGTFQSAVTATVDADGHVGTSCHTQSPPDAR